jgi:hypothetical protein
MLPVRPAVPISCLFLACLLLPVEGSAQAIPLERRAVESEGEEPSPEPMQKTPVKAAEESGKAPITPGKTAAGTPSPTAEKSLLGKPPDSTKPPPTLTERRAAEGSELPSGPPPGTLGSEPLRRKSEPEEPGAGPLPGVPSGVTSIPEVVCAYRAWVEGLPMGELGGSGEMEYGMEITIANQASQGIQVDIVCGMFVEVNGVQEILVCEKPKGALIIWPPRVETFSSDCGRREGVSSTRILLHNAYLRDASDPLKVTECGFEP